LAFLTSISEKHKSTKPGTIKAKNGQKTNGIEEKLDIISQIGKGERIVDICHNDRLAHSCVYTIRDSGDRIKDTAKSVARMFLLQDYHSPIRMNCTKKLWM
jgi:hypothetical protein